MFLFPPQCSSFTGIYFFFKGRDTNTVQCIAVLFTAAHLPPSTFMPVYSPALPLTSSLQERFGKGGKRKETPSVQKKVNSTWRGRRGGNTLQRTVASSNLSCLQCKKEKIRARSMHTKVCATQQRARSVFYVYLTEGRVLILLVRR